MLRIYDKINGCIIECPLKIWRKGLKSAKFCASKTGDLIDVTTKAFYFIYAISNDMYYEDDFIKAEIVRKV